MLKLKSGRVIAFEGIVSYFMDGGSLILELATGEEIQMRNVTMETILKKREDYFAEQAIRGKVTEDFGDKVYQKLKGELELAISTLQAATTAYNTSAELANKSSQVLAGTSDRVDLAADKIFKETTNIAESSARKFKQAMEDTYSNRVHKTATKFDSLVTKLENELKFIGE